jgi:rhamnogalacturonan endolyase
MLSSWQQTAYNQPPHLGFLLSKTASWPTPDITLVGGAKIPFLSYAGAGASNQTILKGTARKFCLYLQKLHGSYSGGFRAESQRFSIPVQAKFFISGTPHSGRNLYIHGYHYGGDGDAYSVSGTINVIAKAAEVAAPASILSK